MKKIILMLVMVFASLSMFAQQTTVEGSKFFDNTYVGVSVGGQVGMNDIIGHSNWTVAPDANLYLGKWFTPIFGMELNGEAVFHDGFSTRNKFVDASYVGLNARLNLNNIFHKYRGESDRVEVIPFVGVGWLHAYGNGTVEDKGNVPTVQAVGRNAFATKMGIDLSFNLGETKAWVIDVRPTVMYALSGSNYTGEPYYNVNKARVGLEVGFTYKFGHKNSKGVTTHNFTKAYTVREYDEMVERLSNVTPDTVVVTNDVVREVVREVPVTSYVVSSPYFTKGEYTLDPTSNKVLDTLATQIKSDNKDYVITGWASIEGEETYNSTLSLHRAEAVRNALVERGVPTTRLSVVAGGATQQFGSDYESNRTVTVTSK
jgi:outer membrane protein OmpA-like peptidoglycan-associated protein